MSFKKRKRRSSGRAIKNEELDPSTTPSPAPDTDVEGKRASKEQKRERKRKRKAKTPLDIPHKEPIIKVGESCEHPRLEIAFKDAAGARCANIPTGPGDDNLVPPPPSTTIDTIEHCERRGPTCSHASKRNLEITLMRHASPQIEAIATSTSPTHIKSAVELLLFFISRVSHVHSQIEAFDIALCTARANLTAFQGLTSNECRAKVRTRIETFEEIIALAEEHTSELCVREFALRDVVDEESGAELGLYVEKMKGDLEDLVGEYKEKLCGLISRVSSETLDKR